MSRVSLRFLPALLFLALISPEKAGAGPAIDPVPVAGADYRIGLEQETFLLVNQYRKTSKLPPLRWDGAIAEIARAHSRDMATGEVDFGHDGFGDRVKKIKGAMIGFRGAGENVLKAGSPEEAARTAVDLWLHSPHHLENIRGDYNFSGLGVWLDREGAIYFTQIFVKIEPREETAATAPPAQVVTPFGMLAVPKTRAGP